MNLRFFILIAVSLCFTTALDAAEYTYNFFYDKCDLGNQGCWLKITTNEDGGGLRCRARPSLRSSIIKVVPKGRYVNAVDFAVNEKGRAFFKVSHDDKTCYMRGTQSRLSYSREYTDKLFNQHDCHYIYGGCLFEVTTSEDSGGLRCRARPSLRASVLEIVPKGHYVSATDLVIGEKRRAFFKVSLNNRQSGYIRATQSRLSYSMEYTNKFFSQHGCNYSYDKSCLFEVTTSEDSGGLNCRARPSLRSPVREIVPKGHYVHAVDLTLNEKGRIFLKVSLSDSICYMRATRSRLLFTEDKEKTRTVRSYTNNAYREPYSENTNDGRSSIISSGNSGKSFDYSNVPPNDYNGSTKTKSPIVRCLTSVTAEGVIGKYVKNPVMASAISEIASSLIQGKNEISLENIAVDSVVNSISNQLEEQGHNKIALAYKLGSLALAFRKCMKEAKNAP